jgi:hypothetical protein
MRFIHNPSLGFIDDQGYDLQSKAKLILETLVQGLYGSKLRRCIHDPSLGFRIIINNGVRNPSLGFMIIINNGIRNPSLGFTSKIF